MSIINANPLLAAAGGDYQISRSVRFRSSASAYFNRTLTNNGNSTKWTFGVWLKRGRLGVDQTIFGSSSGTSTNFAQLKFDSSDRLDYTEYTTSIVANRITSAVYRDPSAYYNIVFCYDSGNATASDRLKLYVNGVEVTAFSSSTNPSLNATSFINYVTGNVNNIGRLVFSGAGANYFDGYLTEVNFIDGQALTPSSFGETDAVTGVWKPKKYAGTYGTNGFYVNFSDNSNNTATTIGKDYSGNGNNWTPNNISVTSGVTYDSMLDVPTPYADGGNGRGNYAVLNPLDGAGSGITFSNGNLNQSWTSNSNRNSFGTFLNNTGKWYFECLQLTGANTDLVQGLAPSTVSSGTASLVSEANYYGYTYAGRKWTSGSLSDGNPTFTVGTDVMCFAVDFDAGKIWLGKNGTWLSSGDPSTGANAYWTFTAGTALKFGCAVYNATSAANFGQRPFSYTPPTGFKALNTQNLPEPTIKKGNQYFDALTWTANGTTQNVTGLQFSPDFWWEKGRSAADGNAIADIVRGATSYLISHSTAAEVTNANFISGFLSNGVSYGSANHTNGQTYVGWAWKEGATQGFDIVTYTGTGANRTVAHSLGVTPSMMIVKSRSSGADGWPVFHSSVGNGSALVLNSTSAINTNSVWWNNTSPSSSVFTVGTNTGVNGNAATYVAYLFAEVAGFSKFDSYTGNGSTDGPFVYCGFRPRFVLVKKTSSTGNWIMYDTARDIYNTMSNVLVSNSSGAEIAGAENIDVLSNGFKLKYGGAGDTNASGATYIFAAFAENPFKNSLAR